MTYRKPQQEESTDHLLSQTINGPLRRPEYVGLGCPRCKQDVEFNENICPVCNYKFSGPVTKLKLVMGTLFSIFLILLVATVVLFLIFAIF